MRPEKIDFMNNIPARAFVRAVDYYPYHWHDTLEIIQVLNGSVNIGMGNDELLLQENNIAIVNVGEIHRITKSSQDNKILFMQIDGNFYRTLLNDESYLFIYCCSTYHEMITPARYAKLKEYIRQLTGALAEKTGVEPDKKSIASILSSMLDYITYNFDFLRWGYGTVPFDERRVTRLKQIAKLTSDQEVRIGLKDLAAEAGISLQHLSNDIKNKFGATFQELLYYGKCEQAAKLLLGSDKKILDISCECGFSDPKYLIKHFKKNFQCTPSMFREKHRNNPEILASRAKYHEFPLSEALRTLN